MAVNQKWYQLPPDPNQWQTLIIENLARKIPEIPRYIGGFEIQRFEPSLGDADCLIYLLNGMAVVPVTIRQFRLAPIDIMMTKNEDFYPITDFFLQKMYSDNVLGQVDQTSEGEEFTETGPSRRVRMYQTVDRSVGKVASIIADLPDDKRENLKQEIEKSAMLQNFFKEHRPDVLEELYKEASEDPDLYVFNKQNDLWNVNGEYYELSDVVKLANYLGADDEVKASLLKDEVTIVVDNREKHAMLMSPKVNAIDGHVAGTSPGLYLATVVDVNGMPHRGVCHVHEHSRGPKCMFIGDVFHCVQNDFIMSDKVPISFKDVINASEAVTPTVGTIGVMISDYYISLPFTVGTVKQFGNVMRITPANEFGMGEHEHFDVTDSNKFYPIPEATLGLLEHPDNLMNLTPGENYTVSVNSDGFMVMNRESYSYANMMYKLMGDLGLSLDDTNAILQQVKTAGSTTFKVAADKDSKEESKKKESVSTKKSEKKESTTKSDSKDSSNEEESSQGQQAQGQQTAAGQSQPTPMGPNSVNAQDMEDVAALNDPSLMDSYLSGTLTDVNTSGRENLMMISDDLFEAIKSLGKLLYLIRIGRVQFVKEEDAMLAFTKLSDVAKNIGIASSQITQMGSGQYSQGNGQFQQGYPQTTPNSQQVVQ